MQDVLRLKDGDRKYSYWIPHLHHSARYASSPVSRDELLGFSSTFLTVLRIRYVRQNRRRDKLLADGEVQDALDKFAD